MNHLVVALLLQALACLLPVQGQVDLSQKGCHKSNIVLDCPHYLPSRPGSPSMNVKWYVSDSTARRLRLVGLNRQPYREGQREKPDLVKRLTMHQNGSLEISSLHPDDEAEYFCEVKPGLKTYRIRLSVTCGKDTRVERKVCVEEEVALECEARHRTNPRKLDTVTWKKERDTENGSLFVKVQSEDGFRVHNNFSLVLPKGRPEGNETFKCLVRKNDKSMSDTHQVKAINVKCYEDTPKPQTAATVKTTQGRDAMTTAFSTKGTTVAMEKTTGETRVCGGVLSNLVGSFQSPNFPRAYPANSHCKWTISLPQDYAAINITLNWVNLEGEEHCQHDYIAIHDELENQIGCRICGSHKFPSKIQVKGRQAVVTFHSDSSVNKSGFKIVYSAVRTAQKSVS